MINNNRISSSTRSNQEDMIPPTNSTSTTNDYNHDPPVLELESRRKRDRQCHNTLDHPNTSTSPSPLLSSPSSSSLCANRVAYNNKKRIRTTSSSTTTSCSCSLENLPIDIQSNTFTFLPTVDLCTMQLVSKHIGAMAESHHVLWYHDLIGAAGTRRTRIDTTGTTTGGGGGTSMCCILDGEQKPNLAIVKLHKYASVGHPQALYMMGMIVTYCYSHPIGLSLLKLASTNGCSKSAYMVEAIEQSTVDRDMIHHLDFHVSEGMTLPALITYIQDNDDKWCCDDPTMPPSSPPVVVVVGRGFSSKMEEDKKKEQAPRLGGGVKDEILERHHDHIASMHTAMKEYEWNPSLGRLDLFFNTRKPELLLYQRSLLKKMPLQLEHLLWSILQYRQE